MKEMENNNFIHTLDAVYNLCSEIKELVNVETEKQEDEGSWKSHATLTPLAKQDCPLWLQYD